MQGVQAFAGQVEKAQTEVDFLQLEVEKVQNGRFEDSFHALALVLISKMPSR